MNKEKSILKEAMSDALWSLNGKIVAVAISLMFIWLIIGCTSFIDHSALVIIGIIVIPLIPYVIMVMKSYHELSAHYEKVKKEHPHLKEEEFYQICKKAKLEDIYSSKGRARLKLLAENNNVKGDIDTLTKMYELGKSEVERIISKEKEVAEKNQKAKELETAKKKEEAIERKNKKYIQYCGREKALAICDEKISFYTAKLNKISQDQAALLKSGEKLYQLSKQKETDWAIAGGIASGIAGPAAGLAAAYEAEQRNAAVRSNNEELLQSIGTVTANAWSSYSDQSKGPSRELEKWRKLKEKVKGCLTDNGDEAELLEAIHPSVKEIKTTKTGSVVVAVSTSKVETRTIFEDVDAFIDGSVKVLVKENNKTLGTGYFCLPFRGAQSAEDYEVVVRTEGSNHHDLKVDFKPNHLWLIEKY